MGTVGLSFGSPTSGAGFDVSSTVAEIVSNLQNVETPWKNQLDIAPEPGHGDLEPRKPALECFHGHEPIDGLRGRPRAKGGFELRPQRAGSDLSHIVGGCRKLCGGGQLPGDNRQRIPGPDRKCLRYALRLHDHPGQRRHVVQLRNRSGDLVWRHDLHGQREKHARRSGQLHQLRRYRGHGERDDRRERFTAEPGVQYLRRKRQRERDLRDRGRPAAPRSTTTPTSPPGPTPLCRSTASPMRRLPTR